jgi:hypothetical protein
MWLEPLRKQRKGQLSALGGMAVGVATLAITLVVTFLEDQIVEIESLNTVSNETSLALNATHTLTEAVDDIPGWIPLIVIAVIGAVLLGLVAMFRK